MTTPAPHGAVWDGSTLSVVDAAQAGARHRRLDWYGIHLAVGRAEHLLESLRIPADCRDGAEIVVDPWDRRGRSDRVGTCARLIRRQGSWRIIEAWRRPLARPRPPLLIRLWLPISMAELQDQLIAAGIYPHIPPTGQPRQPWPTDTAAEGIS